MGGEDALADRHLIEKILRARGEWEPPWKRHRKTRGFLTVPEG